MLRYFTDGMVSPIGLKTIAHIILLTTFLKCVLSETVSESEDIKAVKLEDVVPTNYDTMKPPYNEGKAPHVKVKVIILNVRGVDDSRMSFFIDILLQQFWRDRRLRFPSWIKSNKIHLNIKWLSNFWIPDLYFQNSIETRLDSLITPNLYLWLTNDSSLIFYTRMTLQLGCDMDLHRFPHDIQHCHITIISLAYTIQELDIDWASGKSLVLTKNVILPQFHIANLNTRECDRITELEQRPCLQGSFSLQRLTGFYVINIYIPSSLVVFMSMLTFWIPPEAVPARVTLGVTSLLTIITKQYHSATPKVSYVVALNIWLSCCIAFVFCSLLEYAIVIVLYAKQSKQSAAGVFTTAVVPWQVVSNRRTNSPPKRDSLWKEIKRKIPQKSNPLKTESQRNSVWKNEKEDIPTKPSFDPLKIDHISRFLFPFLFIVQTVVYWQVYTFG